MTDSMNGQAGHGGPPVREAPFPTRGHIGLEEKEAVVAYLDQVIETGTLGAYQGEEEEAYCAQFAEYLGGGYADAVSSGSTAIYVALKALQLEAFSEVIIGPFTDPGGIMPVPLQNMIPMIADSTPGSYNTGPQQIEELISPRTSAIIVPHIAGEPADIVGILALARRHGIRVIEDCAQAHGARYQGQLLGSFGDISAFSTMSGKHHSSGRAGRHGLYTRRGALPVGAADGRPRQAPLSAGGRNEYAGVVELQPDGPGRRGRSGSTSQAAADGRAEAGHRRPTDRRHSRSGDDHAAAEGAWIESSYWFLPIAFHPDRAACDKETFCESLRAEGLPVTDDYLSGMPHSQEWYTKRRVFGSSGYPWASPLYQGDPEREFPCPNAQGMLKSHFNMFFHENWGVREVDDVIAVFQKVAEAYTPG